MLSWTFFATALWEAWGSLISNANLISKVYFPRLIVTTATVVVPSSDFSSISYAIAGTTVIATLGCEAGFLWLSGLPPRSHYNKKIFF